MKVLIVDDEPEILASMSSFIESSVPGVHAVGVDSAKAAIARLRAEAYGLVIADYRMPGTDGLQFLKEAALRWPDMPLVLMTAYPEVELALAGLHEARIRKFLVKPIAPERLQGTVRELVGAGKVAP